MLDNILSILAPHYCYGCQKPPKLMCHECNNYNNKNYNTLSFNVSDKVYPVNYISLREGAIKSLIDGYKFQREKAAHKILAELLFTNFPPQNDSIITTVPTSQSHKRERGYDHMKLIAKKYARLSSVPFYEIIEGNRKYSQHQKNFKDRQKLTQDIFSIKDGIKISKNTPIVLIDDIYTTGATMKATVNALHGAGFSNIKCQVIVYQPFNID